MDPHINKRQKLKTDSSASEVLNTKCYNKMALGNDLFLLTGQH